MQILLLDDEITTRYVHIYIAFNGGAEYVNNISFFTKICEECECEIEFNGHVPRRGYRVELVFHHEAN